MSEILLEIEEARVVLGGRLPTVFERYDFPKPGIVLTENGPKVPVYIASGQGFNFPGRFFLDHYLHPNLERRGVFILDPFVMCGEFVDSSLFDESRAFSEIREGWERFNDIVVPTVNYGLAIPRAGLMVAVCEGSPIDEGMAVEMRDAVARNIPVIAIRSDFRLAENLATGTNPAVKVFASSRFGGSYYQNPVFDKAYQEAFQRIEEIVRRRLDAWNDKINS